MSAPAAVTARNGGVAATCLSPARAIDSRGRRGAERPASIAGMRAISAIAPSVNAASTSSDAEGSATAQIVPASAGPPITAKLKLVASSAFAWASSSSGTITGIRLVNPPKDNGQVAPASSATSGRVQSGAFPASATSPTRVVAASIWSSTITRRRRPVRSSHAPSNGPDTMHGRVTAATVAPASPALPVRSSTSNTTPTENISSASRVTVAVTQNSG